MNKILDLSYVLCLRSTCLDESRSLGLERIKDDSKGRGATATSKIGHVSSCFSWRLAFIPIKILLIGPHLRLSKVFFLRELSKVLSFFFLLIVKVNIAIFYTITFFFRESFIQLLLLHLLIFLKWFSFLNIICLYFIKITTLLIMHEIY